MVGDLRASLQRLLTAAGFDIVRHQTAQARSEVNQAARWVSEMGSVRHGLISTMLLQYRRCQATTSWEFVARAYNHGITIYTCRRTICIN